MSDIWNKIQKELQSHQFDDPLGDLSLFDNSLVRNFQEAIAQILSNHLTTSANNGIKEFLTNILDSTPEIIEHIQEDLNAQFSRDQSCVSLIDAFTLQKGFHALAVYRIAHTLMKSKKSFAAESLRYRSSRTYGIDIHPSAEIFGGVVIDHGTGAVIGETAHVESGCYLFHGVTLGSTGSGQGKRHPTLREGVFVGANATILGNIEIGERSVIAAGSVVTQSVPANKLAAGIPAKIIGDAPVLLPPQSKNKQ
jgi:serine O-acetyltransferase